MSLEIWLWFLVSVVVGGVLTGMGKLALKIKVTSSYSWGEQAFIILTTAINTIIGYFLLSALAGHFLR